MKNSQRLGRLALLLFSLLMITRFTRLESGGDAAGSHGAP